MIKPCYIVRNKTCGAESVVENFHLNLSTVRVASERQFDAQFRCAIECIGIVRHEDIGHVSSHQRFDILEQLHSSATIGTLTLVVDAHEIKGSAVEGELRIFAPKQPHPPRGARRPRTSSIQSAIGSPGPVMKSPVTSARSAPRSLAIWTARRTCRRGM